ncbi:hypothetical protein BH10BAC2_BH10BAC2_48460 [soil metagenome]
MKKMVQRFFYMLLVFLLLLSLNSCLVTLYPIFHERDVEYNDQLIGLWKCTDKAKNISFMEFSAITNEKKMELPQGVREIFDKGYFVSLMNNAGQINTQYFVFLAKIGDNNYLDYYPAEMPAQKNVDKIYKEHCIEVHSNYKCDLIDKDHFEMKLFDQDFVDKLISSYKINIRHEIIGKRNLITASTDDLQKFIIQYSNNPNAFGANVIYCTRIIYN